jgi:hypothetical protein
MDFQGASDIELALTRVGELLAARGEQAAVVVVGGAALNLHGVVKRTTTDVDVIAFGVPTDLPSALAEATQPLAGPLARAVRTVAGDMGLPEDWMNSGPALQWIQGFPPGMGTRVEWRQYGALRVGLASRYDLICFKLHAATDIGGPAHVHYKDLLALLPSDAELRDAAAWVRTQDAGPRFPQNLETVVTHVRRDLRSR